MLKTAIAAIALLAMLPTGSVYAASNSRLQEYEDSCANVLNFARRIVRKETVAAIGPSSHVLLHSICGGVPLNDTGNAGGLRRTIEANSTLNATLRRHGWRADDVVGIAIDGSAVQLYVHRQ